MPGLNFDPAVEFYDATRGYAPGTAARIRDALLQYLGANQQTRFLELGIGTGRIALPFIETGYSFAGVDISLGMMTKLQEKLPANQQPQLCQADLLALPLADASFDVILAVHVFHLFEDWLPLLQETRRVLKPGGRFIMGYDENRTKANPAPALQSLRHKWAELTHELGHERRNWIKINYDNFEQYTVEFLEKTGASVEIKSLIEHKLPPITPRVVAEHLKARSYSSDWDMSPEILEEASRRLDEWLATATNFSNIDEPVVPEHTFKIIVARWPA